MGDGRRGVSAVVGVMRPREQKFGDEDQKSEVEVW